MPRKARITVPGAVHHLMSRGIDGAEIFHDDNDRRFFLHLLKTRIAQSGYLLYAWSLMPNHYHLVVRINDFSLASFMRLLNGQYAQYYRKHLATRGYLFQDRYKSIVTQDQNYIEELVRYVHLNPLRGKLCTSLETLETYPWCGHGVLTGRMKCAFQNTDDVLRRFGATPAAQRAAYREFAGRGMQSESDVGQLVRNSNNETEQMQSTSCWVIGNREFIRFALAGQEQKKVRLAEYARNGLGIEQICGMVLKMHDIDRENIFKKGRNNRRSSARKLCAYNAHCKFGIPVVEIARYFGISSPAVSKLIAAGELLAVKNS